MCEIYQLLDLKFQAVLHRHEKAFRKLKRPTIYLSLLLLLSLIYVERMKG